jgi:hypothetical protein
MSCRQTKILTRNVIADTTRMKGLLGKETGSLVWLWPSRRLKVASK